MFHLNIKTVVSPRGPSVEYLKYFEQSFFRKKYLSYIFRYFCSRADGVIVASNGMLEECTSQYHVKPSRIRAIPNCVDVADERINELANDIKYYISEGCPVDWAVEKVRQSTTLTDLYFQRAIDKALEK